MFRNRGNPTLDLGEFRSSSKSRTQAKNLCKLSNYVMKKLCYITHFKLHDRCGNILLGTLLRNTAV